MNKFKFLKFLALLNPLFKRTIKILEKTVQTFSIALEYRRNMSVLLNGYILLKQELFLKIEKMLASKNKNLWMFLWGLNPTVFVFLIVESFICCKGNLSFVNAEWFLALFWLTLVGVFYINNRISHKFLLCFTGNSLCLLYIYDMGIYFFWLCVFTFFLWATSYNIFEIILDKMLISTYSKVINFFPFMQMLAPNKKYTKFLVETSIATNYNQELKKGRISIFVPSRGYVWQAKLFDKGSFCFALAILFYEFHIFYSYLPASCKIWLSSLGF